MSLKKKKTKKKITAKKASKKKAVRSAPKSQPPKKKAAKRAAKRSVEISTPKKKNPVGKPRFVPTPEQRKNVETLVGLGLRQDEIVLLVDNPRTGKAITEKTLREHFSVELKRGAPKMHSQVAMSIARKAIGDGPQAVTAAIWYTKCRMGWKERSVIEVESKSGVLVAPAMVSPEEWIKRATARTADKKEPGTE